MSSLERYLARLDADWSAGCHDGAELWRRLKADGFDGGLRVVMEWATPRRRSESNPSGRPNKIPSARTIARLMTPTRCLKKSRQTGPRVAGFVSRYPLGSSVDVLQPTGWLPDLIRPVSARVARALPSSCDDHHKKALSATLTGSLGHALNASPPCVNVSL